MKALHCSDWEPAMLLIKCPHSAALLGFEGFSDASHNVYSLATSSWASEYAWVNELILVSKNICKILFYVNPIYDNGFWVAVS